MSIVFTVLEFPFITVDNSYQVHRRQPYPNFDVGKEN
jgi:hypothetical protein